MSFLRTLTPVALLALCTASVVACSQSAESDVEDDGSEIINGEASGAEDDAVVALYRRGKPHCGATVVAENILVTALHCVSEIDTSGRMPMLGDRLKPSELSIRMGARPGPTSAASVSRIIVEDPLRMDSTPTPMSSNDIAILYVQPQNPAFSKIKPRKLATQPLQRGDTVTVVGYGGESEEDRLAGRTAQNREKREGVEILAAAGQKATIRAELDDGRMIGWSNKPREFTTATVACGGDSGGPAFDSAGNLVGIVSAVIGECVEGSLSIFTDIAAHGEFLRKAVQDVRTIGCLRDDQCGSTTSGRICDVKTNRCMIGCRIGGNACESGKTCSAQGTTNGVIGICRGSSLATDESDPGYDNGPYAPPSLPGITCPGNPLCPTGAPTTRECRQDSECKGVNGSKPRTCDVPMGRCLDGCRVATAGMCATGQACVAYQEDPLIGLCSIAQVPTPPVGQPAASPPVVQPEAIPQSTTPDVTIGSSDSDAGAKKKKNKAKADGGGCSVGAVAGFGGLSMPVGFGLALLGLTIRRRRR